MKVSDNPGWGRWYRREYGWWRHRCLGGRSRREIAQVRATSGTGRWRAPTDRRAGRSQLVKCDLVEQCHLVESMTPTELVWLDLGETGRAWVRSSLQQGRALSKAFLAVTELQSTRTWAYVPASRENDVSDDVAGSLASGGVFSPRRGHERLGKLVQQTQGRARVAHRGGRVGHASGPVSGGFHGSFATNETDVFHWYTLREESAPAEVESFIHSRSSVPH